MRKKPKQSRKVFLIIFPAQKCLYLEIYNLIFETPELLYGQHFQVLVPPQRMKMFIDLDLSMFNYAPLQKCMMSMKKRGWMNKNLCIRTTARRAKLLALASKVEGLFFFYVNNFTHKEVKTLFRRKKSNILALHVQMSA